MKLKILSGKVIYILKTTKLTYFGNHKSQINNNERNSKFQTVSSIENWKLEFT